jgi:hypothetical protein
MVLPFSTKSNDAAAATNEPPRILTEEEQILVSIDQGVHEVIENLSRVFLDINI